MKIDITQLKKEWRQRWPMASGRVVIEVFGEAAMQSWEGAEAFIDAYNELEEKTGEQPSIIHVSDLLYLTIKGYWGSDRSIVEIEKLDKFLSKLNA